MRGGGMVYLDESVRVTKMVKDPVVLKTDLWNEENDAPIHGGIIGNIPAKIVFGIEISDDRLAIARKRLAEHAHPQEVVLQQGDIRKLPYQDAMFDVVLDLSTIDHVCPKELHKAIAQYARILKPGGFLLMVAWCDKQYAGSADETSNPVSQYFFSYKELSAEILKAMDILEEEVLRETEDGKFLQRILAQKRPQEAQKGAA